MDDVDCSTIQNLTSYVEKCQFVLNVPDCQSDGFIQYLAFIYCQCSENLRWLGLVPLALFLVVIFLGLTTSANSFFCPSLEVILDHLHLSHNVAGVTFLAFGNGAPDIFSSLAAVLKPQSSSAGMAFGSLLGAAMFLSTVIVGIVTLIKPFHVMERPLLRDLIFYLATIYWTFYILYTGRIRLLDALGFLLLYIIYVIVVVVGRYLSMRLQARARAIAQKKLENQANQGRQIPTITITEAPNIAPISATDEEAINYEIFFARRRSSSIVSNVEAFNLETLKPEIKSSKIKKLISLPSVKELLPTLIPFDVGEWQTVRWYGRILIVMKAPIVFLLTITVPVVDLTKPNNNWSFLLTLAHCMICPIFTLGALQYIDYYIADVFPIAIIALIVGVIMAIIIGCTSKPGKPPTYHKFLAYIGFAMAIIWIYCLANEVVNILNTFGIVLDLSHEILGLTVLAWSNSLGDTVSDITVAIKGYPRMAISACFGGPLFNILVGVGLPFTIAIVRQGGRDFEVATSSVAQILCLSLTISIVTSFLILPISKFRATRPYAIFLLILYVSFLVIIILTEMKIIHEIW